MWSGGRPSGLPAPARLRQPATSNGHTGPGVQRSGPRHVRAHRPRRRDHLPRLPSLIVLLVIAATTAAAQEPVPTHALTRPEAEFPQGFSSIRGFRALSDGRVLVSDQRERKIVLLDFARGTATPVGRPGQGPAEYNVNLELHAMRGDT